MKSLARLLTGNPYVDLGCRLILGVTFLYACIHKIQHPDAFAKIIYGDKIMPAGAINLLAITLPFFELICGICLVFGFFPRSAAVVINAMLLVFIVAITYNLVRGISFDCGCFTVHKAGVYSDPREVLLRDILFFFMGFIVILHHGKRVFSHDAS
jgi:putative oxidoreductase